jgi:hypothetical protein
MASRLREPRLRELHAAAIVDYSEQLVRRLEVWKQEQFRAGLRPWPEQGGSTSRAPLHPPAVPAHRRRVILPGSRGLPRRGCAVGAGANSHIPVLEHARLEPRLRRAATRRRWAGRWRQTRHPWLVVVGAREPNGSGGSPSPPTVLASFARGAVAHGNRVPPTESALSLADRVAMKTHQPRSASHASEPHSLSSAANPTAPTP